MHLATICIFKMQFRTVVDVKVVDVEKRRNPSKHYVSTANYSNLLFTLVASLHIETSYII